MDDRRATNQLTFAQLNAQRSPHPAERVLPNPSAPLEIRPRLKRQAEAILAALRRGPLWTNDLRSMVAQYNARIRELRQYLAQSGLTIDMTVKSKDGNNKYELRPFAGSRYQAELMARQTKRVTKDDGR